LEKQKRELDLYKADKSGPDNLEKKINSHDRKGRSELKETKFELSQIEDTLKLKVEKTY
jgi:hypothetical protein